jgi:TonB family protein
MKINNQFLLWLAVIIVLSFNNCISQEFTGIVAGPVYEGGITALNDFIKQNIVNPEESENAGISGVVTLIYKVNEKGKVEDIKILRGINAKCDSEAIRVTQLISGWQPAFQWGKPVSVRVIMPVEFKSEKINQDEQKITVTGIVTDKSNGKPVEGTLVLVKGTNVGVITDKNGYYSVPVSAEESELEFSSIAHENKVEKVGKNRIINVELLMHDITVDFSSNQLK